MYVRTHQKQGLNLLGLLLARRGHGDPLLLLPLPAPLRLGSAATVRQHATPHRHPVQEEAAEPDVIERGGRGAAAAVVVVGVGVRPGGVAIRTGGRKSPAGGGAGGLNPRLPRAAPLPTIARRRAEAESAAAPNMAMACFRFVRTRGGAVRSSPLAGRGLGEEAGMCLSVGIVVGWS